MAAILHPETAPDTTIPAESGRPDLRVISGGRSRDAMAPLFWRRRLVALALLAGVIVGGARLVEAATEFGADMAAPQPAPIEGPTVLVEARAGDTLWTLARRVHPEGDVRPVVEAMLADRGGADLQVGDEVRVPTG